MGEEDGRDWIGHFERQGWAFQQRRLEGRPGTAQRHRAPPSNKHARKTNLQRTLPSATWSRAGYN